MDSKQTKIKVKSNKKKSIRSIRQSERQAIFKDYRIQKMTKAFNEVIGDSVVSQLIAEKICGISGYITQEKIIDCLQPKKKDVVLQNEDSYDLSFMIGIEEKLKQRVEEKTAKQSAVESAFEDL
jgi:hypothetical protein